MNHRYTVLQLQAMKSYAVRTRLDLTDYQEVFAKWVESGEAERWERHFYGLDEKVLVLRAEIGEAIRKDGRGY